MTDAERAAAEMEAISLAEFHDATRMRKECERIAAEHIRALQQELAEAKGALLQATNALERYRHNEVKPWRERALYAERELNLSRKEWDQETRAVNNLHQKQLAKAEQCAIKLLAEVERLAWMLERIRDSEYDRMSDADALADLAARYDAQSDD